MQRSKLKCLALSAAGFFSELTNGLLGAGGGIIAVFAIGLFLGDQLKDKRDAFANTLAVMLPLSIISAVGYQINGSIPNERLNILVLPALVGGLAGALLLERISIGWLRMIFALIIIGSGISMVF